NPQTDFGWILIAQAESVKFTARRFYSREDPYFAPYLTIEYIVQPLIDRVQRSSNRFNLFFTASAGQSYVVEFRSSLSSSNWQTLSDLGSFSESTNLVVQD